MKPLFAQGLHALIFVLLICCPLAWSWRSFKIVFTRFDYEANSSYVDVKIQLDKSNDSSLNVAFTMHEHLDDVYLMAALAIETGGGNYTTLLNSTVSFCKMLRQRNLEPIVRIIYDDMARHGKLFKECPIRKGTYSVQGYHMDEELLPSYLPETSFKLILRLLTAKLELIFHGELYGIIDKSKGFNNLKMFSLG